MDLRGVMPTGVINPISKNRLQTIPPSAPLPGRLLQGAVMDLQRFSENSRL